MRHESYYINEEEPSQETARLLDVSEINLYWIVYQF
jgi:hypothetical protein